MEKTFLNHLPGLTLSSLGRADWMENITPTWARLAHSATPMTMPISGPATRSAQESVEETAMPSASGKGRFMISMGISPMLIMVSSMSGAMARRYTATAMTVSAEGTSWLLATCPFSRASRSRFGVGCSVFSSLMGWDILRFYPQLRSIRSLTVLSGPAATCVHGRLACAFVRLRRPKAPLRVTLLPLLISALDARTPRSARQRARPLRGRRSVGPPLHAAWPCGGGSSLHGSLTLAPPAVNCFLRFQHIGQGEDGLADEVEQLRRAGEQQTEIEAQQKGGQSALDGHGQHIDVEL